MATRRIHVQVSHEHLDRVADIANALRGAGMTIQDEIPELGHFSGVAAEGAIAQLRTVPGVKTVRESDGDEDQDPPDYKIS